MDKNATIVITGAAGFIGSCLVSYLNSHGYENLILVDEFSRVDKEPNLAEKKFIDKIERADFFNWLHDSQRKIDFVFHLGARTDTTEFDYAVHERLNVVYSKEIWKFCSEKQVPLVYASSAATYGDGKLGYSDDHALVGLLKPLNPYGVSKNEFDKWALQEVAADSAAPPFWVGLKFFNVYGPNEYHKGRMASVIFHSFNQIKSNGFVKLFKSHKEGFNDGEQLRDFIYIKDLLKVCFWFMQEHGNNQIQPGLYNLGTGIARSFNDLVAATFEGLDLPVQIQYIDMPVDLHRTYQYFTEAKMQKLRTAGYVEAFFTLEGGVKDYVKNYLNGYHIY